MSRLGVLPATQGLPAQAPVLSERPFVAQINLRGDPGAAHFLAAVQSALGTAPPVQANTVARSADATLLWLGPDEWLVQLPDGRRAQMLARMRTALAGQFAAVTDVSDGQAVFVLEHAQAAELLARGCPLDLHESVFPVGSCAQSLFAKAGVLLLRDAPQRFEITVRRSFCRYFHAAMIDAARMVGA